MESAAYVMIRPSVVRVERLNDAQPDDPDAGDGPEEGEPLAVFYDGITSPATIVGVQPEQDLAVIRVHVLPDDLIPATLGTTRGLHAGDRVIAVGYPFGIGPSLTSGVVSGMGRDHRSPEGERLLSNLGCRNTEARRLRRSDIIEVEDGFFVRIRTVKGGVDRELEWPRVFNPALEQFLANGAGKIYLLESRDKGGGWMYGPDAPRYWLKELGEATGIPYGRADGIVVHSGRTTTSCRPMSAETMPRSWIEGWAVVTEI